jgi:hypothetical protein
MGDVTEEFGALHTLIFYDFKTMRTVRIGTG